MAGTGKKKKRARPRKKRTDGFDSDVEMDLSVWLAEQYGAENVVRLCQTFTLNPPEKGKKAVKYTPDFMVVRDDDMIFIEAKGSNKARGAASSRRSIKIAASRYWMYGWYWVTPGSRKKKGQPYGDWKFEEISGQ